MAIVNNGLVKVRVKGVGRLTSDLARTDMEHKKAVKRGVLEAAQFLKDRIREKFGTYQPTGGTGGGPWAKLKFETNMKKLRKFGFSNKPLVATGDLRDSLEVIEGGENTNAASVGSNDPRMVYHVYGAPRRNLPPRDLMLVTATEQADACRKRIVEEVWKAYQ